MARILAFHCHPDDIEFWMGGTMALLAEKGHEIHFAIMTGGEVGSASATTQNIRTRRLLEAKQSADCIGAIFHYAGGHDLQVEYNDFYRKQSVRILREVSPDVVFAPPPSDYMIDHELVSLLVRNATFIAPVPNFDCGVPTTPTSKIPYLYYCDAAGGVDPFGRTLPLHGMVNVTTVLDTKIEMASCHKSQSEWLKYFNGFDNYVASMVDMTQKCGRRAGIPFGEGFIQHLAMGHPTNNILQAWLPEYYVSLKDENLVSSN